MSWLWGQGRGSPRCQSIGPVWSLFYAEKYLALKRERVIWERLIGTGKERELLPIFDIQVPLSVLL